MLLFPSPCPCLLVNQPEDAGSYTCVATNSVGQDSWTVTLLVHTHPIFTELLGDVALNKGERLTLFCGVSGIPLPRITWAFNNNIIPGMNRCKRRGFLLLFLNLCHFILFLFCH